jgi:predicted DNA-binding protein with PD1-like motif
MREAAFDEVAVPSHRGRFISAECHGGRGVVSPAGSAVGWFDRTARQYRHIPADEQCEVLSLIGDVAESQPGPIPHAHVVLALPDGTTCGGHLLEGLVFPTLEVVVTETRRSCAR